MNKRIKKKRKLEYYIASLVAENVMFSKELIKQHERIEQLEKMKSITHKRLTMNLVASKNTQRKNGKNK